MTVASDLGNAHLDLQETSCVDREEYAQHGPGSQQWTIPAVMTNVGSSL